MSTSTLILVFRARMCFTHTCLTLACNCRAVPQYTNLLLSHKARLERREGEHPSAGRRAPSTFQLLGSIQFPGADMGQGRAVTFPPQMCAAWLSSAPTIQFCCLPWCRVTFQYGSSPCVLLRSNLGLGFSAWKRLSSQKEHNCIALLKLNPATYFGGNQARLRTGFY